jgi:hypothetical protein
MSTDRPISKEDVALLLASALGQDKSAEVVAGAARSLGIPRSAFTGEEIRDIFDVLVKAEGLVGVVARFAVSRGDVDSLAVRASPGFEPKTLTQIRAAPAVMPTSAPVVDLIPLIAPALGAEKARDAVDAAAARRGVDSSMPLSHEDALAVLDEMAQVEGIVGVVARFAKARFLLIP